LPQVMPLGNSFLSSHLSSLYRISGCSHRTKPLLPTCALYVSTIVLLVLVSTYVHADMSATHENNTTLTGPKMEQERQMLPYVEPTFSDMLTTCCLTRHFGPKTANADIRQTQLSLPVVIWEGPTQKAWEFFDQPRGNPLDKPSIKIKIYLSLQQPHWPFSR
jgi:hypothetical protein